MRTWNDWSDLEVNRKVAEVLGKKVVQHSMMFEGKVWVIEGDNGIERLPDYCNDVVHTWPIILSRNITVAKHINLDEWECFGGGYFINYEHQIKSFGGDYSHENPLRSAMIVFLMMNGVGEMRVI